MNSLIDGRGTGATTDCVLDLSAPNTSTEDLSAALSSRAASPAQTVVPQADSHHSGRAESYLSPLYIL